MPWVPNNPGFWAWRDCICKGYAAFRICLIMPLYAFIALNTFEHGWILLNVPKYAQKHLNKLLWLCLGSQFATTKLQWDNHYSNYCYCIIILVCLICTSRHSLKILSSFNTSKNIRIWKVDFKGIIIWFVKNP